MWSLAKDCPNAQTEKEPEQIQQMYNLDEEQTALKGLHQTHMTISSEQIQMTL